VRLTEVALVTECRFVDSFGSIGATERNAELAIPNLELIVMPLQAQLPRSDRHFVKARSKDAPSASKVFLRGISMVGRARSPKIARNR
jgi:hypothetical protein